MAVLRCSSRPTAGAVSPSAMRPRTSLLARGQGRAPGLGAQTDLGGQAGLHLGGEDHLAAGHGGEFRHLIASLEGLHLVGLMTMPPIAQRPEDARAPFARLRELRDDLREKHPDVLELSMGMSLDYEVAVEEGATMVRIGTALFGPRSHEVWDDREERDGRRVEEDPELPRARRGRRGLRRRDARGRAGAGSSHASPAGPRGVRRGGGRGAHDRRAASRGGGHRRRSTSPSRSGSTRPARSRTASRKAPRSS